MTKKALFMTSNQGIEQDELIKPFEFLQGKGIEVIHAAEKMKMFKRLKVIKSLQHDIPHIPL